ncbi:MAG: tRNA (guanosine(46)-N7)-methyltransferase TrmB [Bacteriovoracaceae bacterium]|nr:tRNA (guanosine(46)-N7)-methyltransferase TrmB [Bacteriovoracaceae bacterium]
MPFENPYKSKILDFQDFVFTHDQSSLYQGNWNEKIFKNTNPIKLEIGSGYGDFMMSYSKNYDHCNFIGLDFRIKRSFFLAKKLESLKNDSLPYFDFRFLVVNAENLNQYFGPQEISEVFYFFPDPWPKKRHHRRRLFQKKFLMNLHPLLREGAKVWVKTDDDSYYQWMLDEVQKSNEIFKIFFQTENIYQESHFIEERNFLCQFPTKFEKLFLEQSKTIKALGIVKI